MKVVELLKIGKELLKMMSENDVKRDDYKFVKMYQEYLAMRKNGVKYRAVIQMLSEEYHTSKASIERAIRRLGKDC
jgi:flagellar basal body rod protein FlgB